jgi:hypothetical protein
MSPSLSRRIVIAEGVLLAFPVTLLALYSIAILFVLPWPSATTSDLPLFAFLILVVIVGLGALACGWRLLSAFAFGGVEALRATHVALWWIASLGVALTVVVPFAALAVVPYVHLLLERRLRR